MRRILSTSSLALLLCSGALSAQIQPYAKNPCYWQYGNQPILLFGGSNRDNIFQWAGDGTRLSQHLDLLAGGGGNYIRCTMSSREYTAGGYRWDLLPYPFAKVDGKYDLRQWNPVYWDKLRTFLAETKKRGIIVQLEIWDRWNECGDSARPNNGWYCSPWNPNNNSTYDWKDSPLLAPGKTAFYNRFHLAAVTGDPVLLPLQQRFVQKIVDEVVDHGNDHVLFQIDNESGIGDRTLEPDPYWAKYIRTYAASKGLRRDLYVCTSRRFHWPTPYPTADFQDWDNPEIRVPLLDAAFNYCDIAQNNGCSGQGQYDNLLWYRAKVLEHGARPINHVKCYCFNWPIGGDFNKDRTAATTLEAGAKFWRAVFGGAAGIRLHRDTEFRPQGFREGLGLSPEAQAHIKSLHMLLDKVQPWTAQPANERLAEREEDEAYCLAEPDQRFAVFFTGLGDRRVLLRCPALAGGAALSWLNVAHSRWEQAAPTIREKTCVLEAPGAGHWIAVLVPAAADVASHQRKPEP